MKDIAWSVAMVAASTPTKLQQVVNWYWKCKRMPVRNLVQILQLLSRIFLLE
jgi:hypothetical protein